MPPSNIITDSPEQGGLSALAAIIRSEHAAVGDAAHSLLEHAMAAGDALREARKIIGHGGWTRWLNKHCDLNERTARRYVQLADARPQLEAIRSRATELSIGGALRQLGNSERPTKSNSRSVVAKGTREPPRPTSSLDWPNTSIDQRRHFLDAVGPRSVFEALPDWPVESFLEFMPAAWRPAITARVLNRLPVRHLVEVLDRKLEDNPVAHQTLKAVQKALEPPLLKQIAVAITGDPDPLDIPPCLRRAPVAVAA